MTQQSGQPNRYVFTAQDIQLTYSTSTLDGQPEFDYQGPLGRRAFKGKEIGTQQSALGTLVSVLLLPSLDATTVSLTLLLPYIQMAGQSQRSFETLAIQTASAGPDTVGGGAAQQTYQVYQLQGTAQLTTA